MSEGKELRMKIFLSHSTRYCDIAKSLKRSLEALEEKTSLDIQISEGMAGAVDWRQWIEDNVKTADVFLLLYPHPNMDMGWCNYELGRFYDGNRQIICIKNTDIPKPPPAFEPYQAYDANQAGFQKFITELFVLGTFTDGKPLNPAIGKIADPYYKRAQDVATELAQMFAEARVREQLYERRIVVSVHYDKAQEFDAEVSSIEGNQEGLSLLGLDQVPTIPWGTVRQSLGAAVDWPTELEKSLPAITAGSLPPALPPFYASTGIYIPVIAKAESVDGVVRKLLLIFVAADADRLRPLLDWSLPPSMPDTLAFLIRLMRMMFRARWEILEPRYQEARYRAPSSERCIEIARSVTAEYERMQRDAEAGGMNGLGKFYAVFRSDLRADVDAYSEEWMQLTQILRTKPGENTTDLSRQLKELLGNNTKWLNVAAKQFAISIADLG
jgi:hypothetical protein